MPHYSIKNLDTNEERQVELPGVLQPVNLLPVPYVSQLEAGALEHRNDCGAAAAVMLLAACKGLQVSVDEFFNQVQAFGDGMLSTVGIRNALDGHQLFTEWRSNLSLAHLFNYLMQNRPAMVLIRYGVLRNAGLTEDTTFDGPHFMVVVGMDTRWIYVNDPLYRGQGGLAKAYPIDLFREAWVQAGRDPRYPAPENSALIPFNSVTTAGGGEALYRGKVKANLRVRSGPSTTFAQVGLLKLGDIISVYTERSGWGEIEPGLWVSLAYVQRL